MASRADSDGKAAKGSDLTEAGPPAPPHGVSGMLGALLWVGPRLCVGFG